MGADIGTINSGCLAKDMRLAISAQTPPPPSDPAPEVLVEFPDNRLLIDLCGEFDRNLADIEQKLAVQLLRRGNQIAVMGAPECAETGRRQCCKRFMHGLRRGARWNRAILIANSAWASEEDGASAGHQLEMFKGGKVEIKTRKKLVEPRTEAQKDLCSGAVRK